MGNYCRQRIAKSQEDPLEAIQVIRTKRTSIKPRGKNQQSYVRAIKHSDINFGIGPAGTGKTFLAVACGVEALLEEQVRRILLVLAIVLFFSISAQVNGDDVQIQRNGGIASLLVFLFILMLELKDKLLAKNELRAGRAVQQALMPEEQPNIKGWQILEA